MNHFQNLFVRNYYASFMLLPFKSKLDTLNTIFQCSYLGKTYKIPTEGQNLNNVIGIITG